MKCDTLRLLSIRQNRKDIANEKIQAVDLRWKSQNVWARAIEVIHNPDCPTPWAFSPGFLGSSCCTPWLSARHSSELDQRQTAPDFSIGQRPWALAICYRSPVFVSMVSWSNRRALWNTDKPCFEASLPWIHRHPTQNQRRNAGISRSFRGSVPPRSSPMFKLWPFWRKFDERQERNSGRLGDSRRQSPRLIQALRLTNKNAKITEAPGLKFLKRLPKERLKNLILDHGGEFSRHTQWVQELVGSDLFLRSLCLLQKELQ
jgi:hypothetical protein